MEHISVQSSNVASIGYDPETRELEVAFHSHTLYRYYRVPKPIYEAFLEADSKGKFLNEYIKNHYTYTRVS